MNSPSSRTSRRKRGTASIWLALMMVPMTGLVGVAVDFGRVAVKRSALQSFVDAKATAAIKEKFGTVQTVEPGPFLGTLPPGHTLVVGGPGGAIGTWDFEQKVYDSTVPVNAALAPRAVPAVGAEITGLDVPLMFGRLFGVEKATLAARAVAYSPRRHIVLVQDLSGSMSGTPLNQAKQSLQSFVSTLDGQDMPGDEVGLVVFGSTAEMREPLGELRNNAGNLSGDINNMQANLGGTNQKDGIDLAVTLFKPVFPQEVARIMIVVTDGLPNSAEAEHIAAADAACALGISVQAVFISSVGVGSQAQQFTQNLACGPLSAALVGTPANLQQMLGNLVLKVPARLVD